MWVSLLVSLVSKRHAWGLGRCVTYLNGLTFNHEAVRLSVFAFSHEMDNWDHIVKSVCDLWNASYDTVINLEQLSKHIAMDDYKMGLKHIHGVQGAICVTL